MTVAIELTSDDIDALSRLVQAEAENIMSDLVSRGYTEEQAQTLAYGSIVDSIINRVAADTWYGSDIEEVINYRVWDEQTSQWIYQYTPIGEAGTTWEDLDEADQGTYDFVENYIIARVNGADSVIGADTHYFNPNISNPLWGTDMDYEKRVTGDGTNEHLFGIPKNGDGSLGPRPNTYTLGYDNQTSDPIDPFGTPPLPDHKPTQDYTPDPPAPTPSWVPAAASGMVAARQSLDPLVIDMEGGGVTLTTLNPASTATFFDLNGDGFAEQVAWVTGDTALLARDINENGIIDDVTELFGSSFADGFALLAALDSNHDLKIDQNDADWDDLLVWADDGDAVTEGGELISLDSAGIVSIDLAGVEPGSSPIGDNVISHTSTVTFSDNSTTTIADAWLRVNAMNSYYAEDYTLDIETLFLPTLRGYGTIPDLHIAMSLDEDLKDMVKDFVTGYSTASLADPDTLNADIEEIMFRWAGVHNVDPGSRGATFDAQKLGFLEHLTEFFFFSEVVGTPNPIWGSVPSLTASWNTAFNTIKAHLILQVGGNTLFENAVSYDPWSGTVNGDLDLSEDAIGDLVADAPAPGPDNVAYWEEIGRFIDVIKGINNLTVDEANWLDDAVYASDNNLSWNDIATILGGTVPTDTIFGTNGNDTLNGDTGGDTISDTIVGYEGDDTIHGNQANDIIYGEEDDDTLYGDAGSDTLDGGSGEDILYGGEGADRLQGQSGNDYLDGGSGGNFLYGGDGDDIYIYNAGSDDFFSEYFYTTTGDDDEIRLPEGIELGDLTFHRIGVTGAFGVLYPYDLMITIDGGGSIQIEHQLEGNSLFEIETLRFYDNSTLDLTDLGNLETRLTNGDDELILELSSTYQDDVVYGLEGDDLIRTYEGDDVLDGGMGNDILEGGADDDTYIASPGFDRIQENGYGGTDTIEIPEEYTVDDVVFYHSPPSGGQLNNLTILIDGLGQIVVQDHFYGSAYSVEYLHFLEDDSTVALTDLSVLTIGTSGNDTLAPPNDNASLDDIFDGREGDDLYYTSGAGDDVFVFSAGNDTINGEAGGEDTIRIRGNYDPGDISIYRIYNGGAGDSLVLEDTDGNTITALSHFHSSLSNYQIEHVEFADSTVWNILDMEIEARGTSGNDTLYGADNGDASSDDIMYGYAGNDNLVGGDGNDILYGGDDNDVLNGGAGNDVLYGGSGTDSLLAEGGGTDILYGEDGVDYLYAYNTTATLYGGAGDDFLYGGGIGAVTTMHGGAGDDTLSGYTGTDIAAYSTAAAGVIVNLSTGTTSDDGDGGSDTLSSIENVIGSDHDDTITGDSNANVLDGGAGDDILKGGAGNDTLTGGAGTDTADYSSAAGAVTVNLGSGSASNDGDSGSDTLSGIENVIGSANGDTITGSTADNVLSGGAGADNIDGGSGNDTLIGGTGADTLNGNTGTDTVDYSGDSAGVTVNLMTGSATDGNSDTDTLSNIENVIGSAYADTLTGSTAANVLNGGAGNDNIDGGSGNDTLIGGAGNDTLTGNTGTDTADYSAAAAGVTVNLSTGSASNDGDGGADTLSGIENVIGSAGADTITGDTGVNELHGGAGNDTINGGNGNDIISGGLGDDTLDGGSGSSDRVTYENSLTAVNINFSTGVVTGEGTDSITGFEKATGSAFDDTFTGNSSVNTFDAGYGDDTVYGAGGNDVLFGDYGDDILYGDDGQDKVDGGEGNDIIYGGAGNDNIGNSALNGGGGSDIIYGGDGDDKMTGSNGSDILYGGDGLDRLEGGDSGGAYGVNIFVFEAASAFNDVDYIVDFNPNQIINGGGVDISDLLSAYDPGTDDIADFVNVHVSGSDTYIAVDADGGGDGFVDVVKLEGITTLPGIDTLVLKGMLILDQKNYIFGTHANETFNGTSNADYIYTGLGMNTVYAGAGNDFVQAGNSLDYLYGEDGDDILWGHTGADYIYGGDGNDYLYGDSNVDHLYGGDGDDVLYGGADGGDFMSGGAGADIMTGGTTWADTFIFEADSVFDAVDTITNFNAVSDYIDISDVLDGFYNEGVDDITDFVTFTENSGDTEVYIDQDGTGSTYSAVQAILLEGVTGLNVATLEGNGHLITSI